jgi:hypothetical protein
MTAADMAVTILVIFVLFFIIYTRFKNQNLRDTYEEIKDLIITPGEK